MGSFKIVFSDIVSVATTIILGTDRGAENGLNWNCDAEIISPLLVIVYGLFNASTQLQSLQSESFAI